MKQKSTHTSWEKVSTWYNNLLETSEDSYHKQVILPNVLAMLDIKKGEKMLDLACGQGFFAREFLKKGALVAGVDISPSLIEFARKNSPKEIDFRVSSADDLREFANGIFDKIAVILSVQNIENIQTMFTECQRVLKKRGVMVLALNHPAFRVLKHSSWGWDDTTKTQYRRIDAYLSAATVKIDMHPGQEQKKKTVSFHRPLQYYVNALAANGFGVIGLKELISHKKSQRGPRSQAEDRIRKEIPLFLVVKAMKLEKG